MTLEQTEIEKALRECEGMVNHVYGSHEGGYYTRQLTLSDANAIDTLVHACRESVMPKWTYCKDAMPTEYDWYSVTIEEQNDLGTFRYTDIISFGNKAEIGNCWFLDREGQQVVAWQARPEPAKPQELKI